MKTQYVLLASGVSVCLIGALLMIVGEGIIGETHTGIAAVIGIVGIGIIGNSSALARVRKQKAGA